MKRSEAILKLQEFIQKYEDCKLDKKASKEILNFLEKELKMKPPGYMKPIPKNVHPLVPGDFKNDKGEWCTPGVREWEPEDETN